MGHLSAYIEPVIIAFLLFLPTAALFTLPFMIFQYRKFGSIPLLRVLIVYAFILYMMCCFLLTVLPLPDAAKLDSLPDIQIQLRPFSTYIETLKVAGFKRSDLSTFRSPTLWKTMVKSSNLFEIFANILMQVPLGIFLRYYFRRNWKQVLLIGFLVSLFYELTQLSGLFFIYPKPYRLCSVDDLIDNTLGAMVGYFITPLFCFILPTRERLDQISIAKAKRITFVRRITSAILDWIIYMVILGSFIYWFPSDSRSMAKFLLLSYPAWVILVFVIGQKLFNGRTPGKLLLKLRLVNRKKSGKLSFRQLIVRYGFIYGLLPMVLFMTGAALLLAMMLALFSDAAKLRAIGLIILFTVVILWILWLTRTLKKHKCLPHRYLSHTDIVKE